MNRRERRKRAAIKRRGNRAIDRMVERCQVMAPEGAQPLHPDALRQLQLDEYKQYARKMADRLGRDRPLLEEAIRRMRAKDAENQP